MVLLADGQGHPMREVSDFSLLPAANATRLIDRMTSANLVHRRVDPDDRRRVLVFFTPRGRKRFDGLAPIVENGYVDLAADAADDLEKMLTQVLALLSRDPTRSVIHEAASFDDFAIDNS
jgi:DNA-binding MarR family transcriptional regulator